MTQYLDEIIGQKSVKSLLKIYGDSYSQTGILPFLLLVAQKGQGKTKLVRDFRKTLVKPDGTRPRLIEVNASTVKSPTQFLSQLYNHWTDGDGAVLFMDEIHEWPDKVQALFLTILEKDRNPIRRIQADIGNGLEDFDFDFTKISFVCATTNHEKLSTALLDRLEEISLEQYSKEELFTILKKNTDIDICGKIESKIKDIFRGHPRDCVKIAENLEKYAMAKNLDRIEESSWDEFCKIMGIHEHGFSNAEIQIIKALGEKGGEASLESLSASTGFTKGVIRQRYEHALLKRGMLEISARRNLTRIGVEFYKKIKDKV